jgi:hypothetical protein
MVTEIEPEFKLPMVVLPELDDFTFRDVQFRLLIERFPELLKAIEKESEVRSLVSISPSEEIAIALSLVTVRA